LAQSEEEFRHCLNANNKDEYSYHGLATLYVEWAKRTSDPSEVADYLAKAEAVVNDGLRHVRVRDGLWIVSSQIQHILGNTPEYMQALVKAATGSSTSVVAKYLLGRAYRKSGDPQKAVEVLKPVIEAHTDEFRVCVEYARAMEALGESYAKCIAVLRLSTLYGLSDPLFIATLGGMMFLNGEFSPARELFAKSYKREFPAQELLRIHYRPRDPTALTKPLRLEGRVTSVKAGHAILDATGFPAFICPGSKFGTVVMRTGLRVQFEPAFNAKGPLADRVSLWSAAPA